MSDRLRVTALTGGAAMPSARFRIEQLVPALAAAGVDVDLRTARVSCYPPRRRWLRPLWLPAAILGKVPDVVATHRAQVTLLQREFVSTLVTLEGATRRPRVFDVDDAIWLNRGSGAFARRLARSMDVVVAGNAFVAEWFGRYCDRVEVLPTAVDTDRFVPAPAGAGGGPPTIGWTGSSANFPYLLSWQDGLRDLMERRGDLRLRICAERRPPLDRLPAGRVEWVPWRAGVEVLFLQSLDVGLMPLADSDWARGKCSYKMLLYLACGVPAVVSPVGMNREVLEQAPAARSAATAAEAAARIEALLDDPSARAEMGRAGRRLVLDRYSVQVVAPRLAGILAAAAAGGRRP